MPQLYARTLRRAAEILGGAEPLAARLGVSASQVDLWIRGFEYPPGDVFVRAAEVLAEHELDQLRKGTKPAA